MSAFESALLIFVVAGFCAIPVIAPSDWILKPFTEFFLLIVKVGGAGLGLLILLFLAGFIIHLYYRVTSGTEQQSETSTVEPTPEVSSTSTGRRQDQLFLLVFLLGLLALAGSGLSRFFKTEASNVPVDEGSAEAQGGMALFGLGIILVAVPLLRTDFKGTKRHLKAAKQQRKAERARRRSGGT